MGAADVAGVERLGRPREPPAIVDHQSI
jgi:hypothetical protein